MFWRRIAVALIVLLTAMVSFAGATNSAQASPHGPLYPAPKEGPKVILSETSLSVPPLWRPIIQILYSPGPGPIGCITSIA
jgi:hypothetical protein